MAATSPPPPSTTGTLTINTTHILSLLTNTSSLSPLPTTLPLPNLIPKTRFIVDGFKHSGDHSAAYFLSHFHSDHYSGLASTWHDGLIFCSQITANLLTHVLKINSDFIHPLPLSEPMSIDGCEVVLIDANHCPGAVQFLFKVPVRDQVREGVVFERYVHTGDFRFCDAMRLDSRLSEFVGCDAVFLDTTYCNPKFVFPDQQESIDYVVSVINEVGGEGNVGSVLFLVATYVIGKEKILIEIANRCKRKVCVDARKMSVLSVLGYGESGVFTEDESESDVHVVGWNVLGETWPYFRPNFSKMNEIMVEKGYTKVVGFVPTGWTYEMKRDKFSVRSKGPLEIHLVPYSEHSNYDELREYVRVLKPKRVIPTVGSDVEKLDSKHASKMRKYFAGLVDEMANKHDFLMSFHRVSREPEEKLENNDDAVLSKELEQEQEIKSSELQNSNSRDSTVLNDEDMEELLQQLRDCLPIWATRTQMIDLISKFGGNTVDAVSNFYESETEFHEQVAHLVPASTSQTSSYNESASLPYSSPITISPKTGMHLSQSKDHKLPSKSPLIKNSVSPGKRKKTVDNKINKKVRSNLNLEPNGSKQSTITRFFNKVGANATKVDGDGTHIKQCPTDNTILPCNAVKSYNEEINQFIQIINGSDTSRSFAATILESTKGDISKALDIYYSSESVQRQPFSKNCSSGEDVKVNEKLNKVAGLSVHEQSSEKLATSRVCLLPKKYSPIEDACWSIGQPAPYIHLARTFELVEGEKGKIKITSMLCNMFRSLLALSPGDVLPAIYLCTNKIAADHENTELNIGGSIVTTALEEACGTNRSKIKELYNSLGDLGDVAQLCRQKQKLLAPPPPLLIKDVFSALWKISVQTGPGSTAHKKSLIVNLMRSCREKEIKFLVRTLVRNLRIGAMMRTVLPALAHAVVLNTSSNDSCEMTSENLKDKLQCISAAAVEAYNMLPSLDLLVPSLMNKGIEFSSSTLSVIPGIPIKPMLAKITNGIPQVMKMFQNKAFTCEYKYDGQRAQIHKLADGSIHVFSRNGDETTSRFPDLVNIVLESCKPAAVTFILDAEVVAVDRKNGCKLMSFQELASRERGGKASFITMDNIKVDICVFVFDVMFANGERLMGSPLRQRRTYLKDLFFDEKSGYFEYAKETTVEANDALPTNETTIAKINSFLDDAFRSSCEGIMVKILDIDADYSPSKRTDTWLKVKQDYVEGMNDSLDLVPIGAWHGNGRKAGWFSPFLMACYNPDTEEFQSVCRVMSGFSDSFYTEMKSFFSEEKILSQKPTYYQTAEQPDMWLSAELVWAIRGADFTVSPVHHASIGLVHPSRGISIRFPRFIRTVSDRRPEECSTSGDIADMFHSQTRKMDINVKK